MKTLFTLILCSAMPALQAQQLYFEGFGSLNRTAYSTEAYAKTTGYLAYGGRVAVGADHFQVGGEYRSNLTHPEFESGGTTSFEETYYGGFFRAKISRYPAMRFGLVLRAGAGILNTTAVYDGGITKIEAEYDPIVGYNAGAGFSIPLAKIVMLELGYTYNYVQRPELNLAGLTILSEHTAAYHAIQAGLSLNFVFGKRAKEYEHVRENQKWRNGWKG
ncbi:MAG: outer membrane beta-barrel protein [Bacteroidetes bacterium]|nr:outer membrane beta-barrel protein [Bacteroidota bacterium]